MANALYRMSHIWDIGRVRFLFREVRISDLTRKEILTWPEEARKELGSVLTRLQRGVSIGMPDVRPMPTVERGVSEIRIKIEPGIFRAFYVIESEWGILVFHGFSKKTQKTPQKEIETGRQRLKAFLKELDL